MEQSPLAGDRVTIHKKGTLTPSIPHRLEGLAVLMLAISVIIFLGMSMHTLYQFPVFDGYRWYGDESWSMIAWKNLISHGRMIVPFALGSQLLSSPGLLLGSPWIAAVIYGTPQLLSHAGEDAVNIGRVASLSIGIVALLFLGWTCYRLQIRNAVAICAIAILATSRSFTFATHSARYDILTGFALLAFVGVLAMMLHSNGRDQIGRSTNIIMKCFLISASGVVISFTISPHLEAMMPLIILYAGWRFGALRRWNATAAFFGGGVLAMIALIALYAIPNHTFSFTSGISSDNQFGSVLNNLPILHLFSWSAQRHQLWAKGFYLCHEAPLFAFLVPLVIISEGGLILLKRPHSVTAFVTACLALALLVALFVQSTLPYYLIHVLPLATLAFALHLQHWSKPAWTMPVIALVSLALSTAIWLQWIPDLGRAGRIGNHVGEANTAAIQAAIEEVSRDWEPSGPKPLILAQGPAIHELLRDTAIRVMSESFLFFPIRHEGNPLVDLPDSVMSRAGVQYILDYNKPMTVGYEMAVRRWEPVFTRVGPLLDCTLDYFRDSLSEIDTLTLYQVDTSK